MRFFVVAVLLATLTGCASAPHGTAGEKADALADRIDVATGQAAWRDLAVVAFTFRGTRTWLWDKARGLVRMEDNDGTVFIDTWDHGGFVVDAKGNDVVDADRLKSGWAYFINDTFWLNPMASLRNEGAIREIADVDGATGLVVRFESGGVTPGDTYLFFVDDTGLPLRWRLWTSALPIKGFETTFEGWVTVGGAKIATAHGAMGSKDAIGVAPVAGGATFKDAGVDEDPFARLRARRH